MKASLPIISVLITGLAISCDRPATVDAGPAPRVYAIVDLSGGPEATNYAVTYLDDLPTDSAQEEYKTDKLILRWIASDTFTMGQPVLATPVHSVTLSKGFYIALWEITEAQWENVMGPFTFHFDGNPTHPAESVSWEDIRGEHRSHDWPRERGVGEASFMGRLSAKTPAGMHFDLPTEAQWEFACRAGTDTRWSFGDSTDDANDHLWSDDNSEESSHRVGTLKPNPWGLFDLHGNVAEWCLNRHGSYPRDAQTDPEGPSTGWHRIWRGGDWAVAPYLTQCAARGGGQPSERSPYVGFRPVSTLAP
ncbi:MAG: SUMF1/EgtB/PvdO family nonheme iron enzyme [Akkermansiaceae bacterium]